MIELSKMEKHTQEYLLREVWGPEYGTEANYLRVYIGQLRKKLGDEAANPRLIEFTSRRRAAYPVCPTCRLCHRPAFASC